MVPLDLLKQILFIEPDLDSRAVQYFQVVVTSQIISCQVDDSLRDIISRVTICFETNSVKITSLSNCKQS